MLVPSVRLSLVMDPRVMGDSPNPTIVKVMLASIPGPVELTGTYGVVVMLRATAPAKDSVPAVLLNFPSLKTTVPSSFIRSPLTTLTPYRTTGL